MFFLKSGKKEKVLLLQEGKKKIGKVLNAQYNFNKKLNKEVSKASKKTFREEKEMKKWSVGSIIAAIGVILTIFWTYTNNTETQAKSFQKLESGLDTINKNQDRLIKLTEKISEKQSDLKSEVATIKATTEIQKAQIKTLDDRLYKRKRR